MGFSTNILVSLIQRRGLDHRTVQGPIRRLHRYRTVFLVFVEAFIGLPMPVTQQHLSGLSHSPRVVILYNLHCKDTLPYRSTLTLPVLQVIQ